ncbi:MAG: FAD binding domain-containing protein [Ignavibacteria bacterium]|nr:FAD binding domain-containing protein [Ignavibacteria bacterium]
MINFILNTESISTELPPGMPLLDFVRDNKKLKGTKEGCREGDCGACLILLGEYKRNKVFYKSVNSCLLPLGEVNGKQVVTIEGVNSNKLNLIQQAFVDEGASQCGFCTPGFILSLTAYFLNAIEIKENEAISSIDGNICRCTGYTSIIRAIQKLCKDFGLHIYSKNGLDPKPNRLKLLVDKKVLPEYFLDIPDRLHKISLNKKVDSKIPKKSPVFIAGGTDLYIQKPDELSTENLVFLSQKKKLKKIWRDKDRIFIGSMTTVEDIKSSSIIQKLFPETEKYFKLISSTPIRYRATVGGNIVNASPIGDLTIFLLALNTMVVLNDGKKQRELLLRDFYKGYKQLNKKRNDILEYIWFKKPNKNSFFNFEKVSRRKYLDIASVNSAILIQYDKGAVINIHLSAGGIAPIPLYLSKVRSYLLGKEINSEIVKEASRIAQSEISPISDVRGSNDYKRLLLRQLIYCHFVTLFPKEVNVDELL